MNSAMPTDLSAVTVRSRHSDRATPRYLKLMPKFSATLYQGNSVLSWNTNAILSGSGPLTTASCTVTAPSVGSISPPIILSRVLFPQPDGPSRQRNSPRLISSDTWSRASTVCEARGSPYRWVTFATEIATEFSASAALGEGCAKFTDFLVAIGPPDASVYSHRHELSVVKRGGCGQDVQDTQILE